MKNNEIFVSNIKKLNAELHSLRNEITKLNEILRITIPNYDLCRVIVTDNKKL